MRDFVYLQGLDLFLIEGSVVHIKFWLNLMEIFEKRRKHMAILGFQPEHNSFVIGLSVEC